MKDTLASVDTLEQLSMKTAPMTAAEQLHRHLLSRLMHLDRQLRHIDGLANCSEVTAALNHELAGWQGDFRPDWVIDGQ